MIVNISNPSSPTVVTSVPGYYSAVAVSQDVLIADNPYSGIDVMDISHPDDPTIIGHYSTHEFIVDMDIQGQYLFTTSETDFHVYQVDALSDVGLPGTITPHEFALYPCYPNPFNASTVINYSLPQPDRITLTIWNILGQRMHVLYDGVQSGGQHSIIWDATNYSSGIYFAQLQSDDQVGCIKMVLAK